MADADTTRFPFINLEKAVARARQMYNADPQGRQMRVREAFLAWEYSEKSSGGFQTISALKMYGLLEDFGANEDRKVALSNAGRRYFIDEREDEQAKLLRQFALSPKLLEAVYRVWGGRPPADNIARSQLKLDWKLAEQSSRAFLGIYKENLDFAGLSGHDSIPQPVGVTVGLPMAEPQPIERPFPRVGGDTLDLGPSPTAPREYQEMALQQGERVVFSEEAGRASYLRLVASGEMDDALLEALESYVKRQRARLAISAKRETVTDDAATPATKLNLDDLK